MAYIKSYKHIKIRGVNCFGHFIFFINTSCQSKIEGNVFCPFHDVFPTTSISQRLSYNFFLITTFSQWSLLQRLSHSDFLTMSFRKSFLSKCLSHNYFFSTSISQRLSLNVFIATSFSQCLFQNVFSQHLPHNVLPTTSF